MLARNIILATATLFSVLATSLVHGAVLDPSYDLLKPEMENFVNPSSLYRRHHNDQNNQDGHHGHRQGNSEGHKGQKGVNKTHKKGTSTDEPAKKDPSTTVPTPETDPVTTDSQNSATVGTDVMTEDPMATPTATATSDDGTVAVATESATWGEATATTTSTWGVPTTDATSTWAEATPTMTWAAPTTSGSVAALIPSATTTPHSSTPFPPSNNAGVSKKIHCQAVLGLVSVTVAAFFL
ncbi:hypothetical protein EDD21DRAFT_125749 [Dissophora ornata]|nr:hypothetical protein BGZ58_010035 [Dissophora ornata]KAI8600749.1 hypothetical protein EDD21DRAFT_125749 [Dissophora ornata]